MSDRFRELFLINAEKRDFPSPRGKGEISLGAVPLSRFDSRFVFSTREQGFSKVCSALEKVFSRKRNFLISPRRERSCFSPSKGPSSPPSPLPFFFSRYFPNNSCRDPSFRNRRNSRLALFSFSSSISRGGTLEIRISKETSPILRLGEARGRGECGDKILVVPRQEFRIIGRVSRGYNFPTQFSFQSPPNESSLGWWMLGGKWQRRGGGGGREKEKELALMEGGGGRAARSPYSCIVARSIAFSTELNSTQQWRTQWAV